MPTCASLWCVRWGACEAVGYHPSPDRLGHSQVLDAAHEMLLAGQQITQRELYYRLLSPPLISTPAYAACYLQEML